MNREQLYNETVDIILDAYNDRKLRHADACGCFIGNIIGKKCDLSKSTGLLANVPDGDYPATWYRVISKFKSEEDDEKVYEDGIRQIESTGYLMSEVIRLEKAFEKAASKEDGYDEGIDDSDLPQIEGMKAALKELALIHEAEPQESLDRLEKIHKDKYECVLQ